MGLSRNFVIFPKRPGVFLEGVPHCFLMFFYVLKVQEPPGNDSEWFSDRSFSHHFFSILSLFVCRMSGARILAPKPLWGGPAQFRYVKGYSDRSGGVRKVFGFKNLIFHFRATNARSKVRLTQNTLPSSMFGNMFSERPWLPPRGSRRATHASAWRK